MHDVLFPAMGIRTILLQVGTLIEIDQTGGESSICSTLRIKSSMLIRIKRKKNLNDFLFRGKVDFLRTYYTKKMVKKCKMNFSPHLLLECLLHVPAIGAPSRT